MKNLKNKVCPICQNKFGNLTLLTLIINGLANCNHCNSRVSVTRSKGNKLTLVFIMLVSAYTFFEVKSLIWIVFVFFCCSTILIIHTYLTSDIAEDNEPGNLPLYIFGHYCRVFLASEEIRFYGDTVGKNIYIKKTSRGMYTTIFLCVLGLVFMIVPKLDKIFGLIYLMLPIYTYLDLKIRFQNVVELDSLPINNQPYRKLKAFQKVSFDGLINIFIHFFIFIKIYEFLKR